jgi:AAA15 family ATPase/GTPase
MTGFLSVMRMRKTDFIIYLCKNKNIHMLDSLYIKNYRSLKELKVDSLDRINLITGRNNTGKSTVLEAIAIYASKGDLNYILQLLENRGEYSKQSDSGSSIEDNLLSFASLFPGRKFECDKEIAIGDKRVFFLDNIRLKFVRYIEELQKNEEGVNTIKRSILSKDVDTSKISNYKIGYRSSFNDSPLLLYQIDSTFAIKHLPFQFVRATYDHKENGLLFDKIALTEKEDYVVEALKIIEPQTERIAFKSMEHTAKRYAIIKLSNHAEAIPMESMGDGINHVLTIILALINAENGFLLIDEFENGLHYTVQEQLWKIIFRLSQKLNVQVFATTHSNDCISGFAKVLNSPGNTDKGKLIRLENVNGEIKPVEYSPEELEVASENSIETR